MADKITTIAAYIFVASCVGLIFGSMTFGEAGVAWITVLLLYPALIVLFGNIGISDAMALNCLLRQGKPETADSALLITIALGRGLCFIFLSLFFIYMEFKVVQGML